MQKPNKSIRAVKSRPVPGTRPMNRVPGSVLPVLLPESEILWRDKQDRQGDLPLETAKHFVSYALPTKLSRCNDNASKSTLSGLATFVLIFLFSGTRIPDRYGNRVPGSKNIRKRTGLVKRR